MGNSDKGKRAYIDGVMTPRSERRSIAMEGDILFLRVDETGGTKFKTGEHTSNCGHCPDACWTTERAARSYNIQRDL